MYCKLGQACVTNWGSFALLHIKTNVLANWSSFIITNWGQMLLQIGAAITNKGNRYYKIGQLLQIGAIFITNWVRYYKFGQLIQIGV